MKPVKDSQLRTLGALGYQIGNSVKAKLIKVYSASGPNQEQLLLISSRWFGPGWPIVARWLQEVEIEFGFLEAGKRFLVIGDSQLARERLADFSKGYKSSRANQIFIQDHGFVESSKRRRFEPSSLLLPVLSLIGTTALVFFTLPGEPRSAPEVAISCILDSKTAELAHWVEQQLNQNPDWLDSDSKAIPGDLGTLLLETTQSIGTTKFVSAQVVCKDQRQKQISFRTDSSGGPIYSFAVELDS